MKRNLRFSPAALLLLSVPLFINGMCNKNDVTEIPNADEYATWQIQGYNGNITTPPDEVSPIYPQPGFIVLFGTNSANDKTFYASFGGTQTTGTFPTSYFNIYYQGKYFVQGNSPMQLTISTYGAPGQYITGSYSGILKDSTSTTTYNVAGNFRIKNQ